MQGSKDMGVIGVEVVARQNTGHLWVSAQKALGEEESRVPNKRFPSKFLVDIFFVNPSCNEVL